MDGVQSVNGACVGSVVSSRALSMHGACVDSVVMHGALSRSSAEPSLYAVEALIRVRVRVRG